MVKRQGKVETVDQIFNIATALDRVAPTRIGEQPPLQRPCQAGEITRFTRTKNNSGAGGDQTAVGGASAPLFKTRSDSSFDQPYEEDGSGFAASSSRSSFGP